MELEERVASAIRAQTDLVELDAPDAASIRRSAITQVRRRAAAAAGAAVVLAVVALTVGLVDLSPRERSVPPADRSEGIGARAVVTIPAVRAKQVVVRPSVRSSVIPGERLVVSASTDDPSYDGAGEITLPLDLREQMRWEVSCSGAPQARYVVVVEPDALYFSSGRCDGTGVTNLHDGLDSPTSPETLRMFVTEEDLGDFRRCFNFDPPGGCEDVEPLPVRDPKFRMRAAVYVEEAGPVVVSMFGQQVHARASAFDSAYSLTTAAAAASGARELAFRVGPSTSPRIAQATQESTERWGECIQKVRPSERDACLPTVKLLIDGQPVEDQGEGPFDGSAGWGPLEPGGAHTITFRVTRGDARNVDLGVLVYQEDP